MRNPHYTAKHVKAIREGTRWGVFFYLDHPAGDVYTWTGNFPIEHEGNNYTGLAGIAEVTGLERDTEVNVQEVAVRVSGFPNRAIPEMELPVLGRKARLYKGYVDARWRVIDNLIPLADYVLYNSEIAQGSDTFAYTVVGAPGIVRVRAPTRIVWTTEYQKDLFPNQRDDGFNDVEVLQDKSVQWAPGAIEIL